jgi:hypothetical protein
LTVMTGAHTCVAVTVGVKTGVPAGSVAVIDGVGVMVTVGV